MFRSVLAVLLLQVNIVFASDWPNWRGPDHDGISLEKNWDPLAVSDTAKPVWTAQVGIGFSTITVADGKAITMGNVNKTTDVITCFDAATGAVVWKYEYAEPLTPKYYEGGPNATATIADGKVYTLSKTGKAFCLNLENGQVLWEKKLDAKIPEWGFAGSPLRMGDKIIYNVFDSGVALNKVNGEVLWTSSNKESGYATAVAVVSGDKSVLYLMGREHLMCLNPADGTVLWAYPWKTKYDVNASDPVVVGNEVFISSGYNHGSALLRIEDCNAIKVWENKNMRSHMSGPVYIDGYLYGFDESALVCLDWKTGETKWSEASTGKASLMAADGKLIVISEKGKLMIVKAAPEKFELISSAQVLDGRCWTMPTLANGKIYVRNAAGKVVCMDVSVRKTASLAEMGEAKPAGDWPQWKGAKQDNKSTETGLLKKWPDKGPAMLWSYEGLGAGFSTVSIAEGLIYTTGMTDSNGILTCLDLNGKLLWKQSYGPEWTKSFPGVRSTPTVNEGKVYVISGRGQIACFDAKSGSPVWQKDTFSEFGGKYGTWGVSQSPVIDGDKLFFFVCGAKASVVALNKHTGQTVWTSKVLDDGISYCTPLLIEYNGRKLLAGYTSKSIIGVDAKDGAVLWTYAVSDYVRENRSIHPNTPVYQDGMLFCTSGYDMGSVMLAIDPNGSAVKKAWSNLDFDNHHGSVVCVGDYLYGANWKSNGNGNWMCVDWKTGKTLYNTNWKNKGSLTYADGMLYCYEEKSGTVGLVKTDPAGFEVMSSFSIPLGKEQHWAHPVVCAKRLYIRHGDVLMAYDIAATGK